MVGCLINKDRKEIDRLTAPQTAVAAERKENRLSFAETCRNLAQQHEKWNLDQVASILMQATLLGVDVPAVLLSSNAKLHGLRPTVAAATDLFKNLVFPAKGNPIYSLSDERVKVFLGSLADELEQLDSSLHHKELKDMKATMVRISDVLP